MQRLRAVQKRRGGATSYCATGNTEPRAMSMSHCPTDCPTVRQATCHLRHNPLHGFPSFIRQIRRKIDRERERNKDRKRER